jgi:hypothetical protein
MKVQQLRVARPTDNLEAVSYPHIDTMHHGGSLPLIMASTNSTHS